MKTEEFWNKDAILKDCLFDTNMSIKEISEHLCWSRAETNKRIKQLGLEWVRRNNRKLSRGHAALTEILQKLLPGETIVNEHHIGERLMLDIYCPSYRLALEYHGRQHFFYSNLFHKDQQDFIDGQKRDERKVELCAQQGIILIAFRFNDTLTDDSVYARVLDGIRSASKVEEEKKSSNFKGNHFYEKMLASQRVYNRERYKQYKKWKAK